MTSTDQATGSTGSTGERAGKRRRNIILGAVAVGVLALALLAVGVLPKNSGTSGTFRKPPVTIGTTTTSSAPTVATLPPITTTTSTPTVATLPTITTSTTTP